MFCANCGSKIEDNVKFCPNCGKPIKGDDVVENSQSYQKVSMGKTALLAIRSVCIVVVGCFFLSYFVISCQGVEVNISGMEAAFGMDKGNDVKLDPYPILLGIPLVALIVLLLLIVPSVKKNSLIPIVGGIIGIILHIIANNAAISSLKSEGFSKIDISQYYHTGIGFKISVVAFIVLVIMPFVDKILSKETVKTKADDE